VRYLVCAAYALAGTVPPVTQPPRCAPGAALSHLANDRAGRLADGRAQPAADEQRPGILVGRSAAAAPTDLLVLPRLGLLALRSSDEHLDAEASPR
jgi:hypothetical protein